jgi:hypothetical protein
VVASGSGTYAMNNGNDLLLLPFGSLAGSDLDGAIVTDNGVVRNIEDAITDRPVMFESFAAIMLEDLSGYNAVATRGFYGGWAATTAGPKGGATYHRDGTTGTASTAYSDNSGFYDANGDGFSISTENGRVHLSQLGAVGDNSTDDILAFEAAIALGVSLIEGDNLTYKITDRLTLLAANSNITFDLNGGTIAPNGAAVTNAFYIPSVGDGDAGVAGATNVTLRNLNTDGTNAAAASGIGILTYNADTLTIENVQNDNWSLSGGVIYGLVSGAVSCFVSNIRGTGNTNHGFAVATLEMDTSRVVIDGAWCWSNGLGIDISSGSATVSNVYCWDNTNGGMKAATDDDQHLILNNADLSNNAGGSAQGFYTNGTFKLLELNNVRCNNNGSNGINIAHAGIVVINNLSCEGNGGIGLLQSDGKIIGNNIYLYGNTGKGYNANTAGEAQINNIEATMNGAEGIDIAIPDVTITNFHIEDNCDVTPGIGLRIRPGAGAGENIICSVGKIIETRATAKQTTAININANGEEVGLSHIRFEKVGTVTYLVDAGTDTRIIDCQGEGNETYTETNVLTDRTYDADATTTDELADVLGTLIADLRAKGIVS